MKIDLNEEGTKVWHDTGSDRYSLLWTQLTKEEITTIRNALYNISSSVKCPVGRSLYKRLLAAGCPE